MSETTTIYQQHKSFPNQFFVEVLVVWVMNKMCFHQPRRLMFVLPWYQSSCWGTNWTFEQTPFVTAIWYNDVVLRVYLWIRDGLVFDTKLAIYLKLIILFAFQWQNLVLHFWIQIWLVFEIHESKLDDSCPKKSYVNGCDLWSTLEHF